MGAYVQQQQRVMSYPRATIATPDIHLRRAFVVAPQRRGYAGSVRVAVNGETRVPSRRLQRGVRGATIR